MERGREVRPPLGAESKERQNEYIKIKNGFQPSTSFILLNKLKNSSTDGCDF